MTIHRIKIKDLNLEFIRQLREEAQDDEAELTIWFTDKAVSDALPETEFWKIIALLDWEGADHDAAIIAPAVQYLSEMPIAAIGAFEDILSYKLYLLDGQKFAEHTGDNAYRGEDQPFSADEFLYARCLVVARGEKFYTHVLEHPEAMPKNETFEALLKISGQAFRLKTGNPFDYIPTHIMETFANAEGWNGKGLLEKILSS